MTLKDFFSQDRFARLAGAHLTTVRPGYAEAEMTVGPDVLNASGWLQGGALFTLADLAFAAAVNTHGGLTVSADAHITFCRSARPGDVLHAQATELVAHHRLPYAEVRITDQNGRLVAHLTSRGYRKTDQAIDAEGLE